MTTGRINQVAAVLRRRPGEPGPRCGSRLFGSLLPTRLEQNASSHGFRTCPYPATRRRQDPLSELARIEWGPADRALRCTSTNSLSVDSDPKRAHRPTCGGIHLQGAIGAVGCRTGGLGNHRSVRPEHRDCLKSSRTSLVIGADARKAEPKHRRPEACSLSRGK